VSLLTWILSLFSWFRKLWYPEPHRRKSGPNGPDTTVEFPLSSLNPSAAPESSRKEANNYILRFGVVSAVGNVREHNEDRYYVPYRTGGASGASGIGTLLDDKSESRPPALFIVADGMGGQQAGEKASTMAVDHIPEELYKRLESIEAQDDDKLVVRAIKDAVAITNQEILSLASLEAEYSNMGTTVVLAWFMKDRVYVTGIGDSRAYRFRNTRVEQLTRDHSLADALGEAGTITREEVATHKFKNVLYLYLGSKEARGGPEEVRVLDVRLGDRFLLATDGLTGVMTDERLAELVRTIDDPQGACQVLVQEALENGSKDNVTCEVIHVVDA
jgi:PPM family protein phosphatase